MNIEKNLDIYIIKLLNGDDVVCETDLDHENTSLVLERPLKVFSVMTKTGMASTLDKWFPFSDDDTIVIDRTDVVAITTLSDNFKEYYIEVVEKIWTNDFHIDAETDIELMDSSPKSKNKDDYYKMFLEFWEPTGNTN